MRAGKASPGRCHRTGHPTSTAPSAISNARRTASAPETRASTRTIVTTPRPHREAFAAESAARRLSAGVSAARVDAYRRMFARGFRTERMGVSMWLRPDEPRIEAAADYVVNDLR